MKEEIHKNIMIKNYNNKISNNLPDDAEVCAHCLKAQVVPLTAQENYLTVKVWHHYGSPYDGDVEQYDVCLPCFDKFINIKRNKVSNYIEGLE
tara:strand:- start:3352 stop:3630 length:279 start_codon:yes stop_codon:yes gene_type:complete